MAKKKKKLQDSPTALSSAARAKLEGDELRRFLSDSGPDETLTVLIRPDIPPPRVEPTSPERRPRPAAPFILEPEAPADGRRRRQAERRAGQFLAELLGKAPPYIGVAKVFVAEVDRRQLEKILASPTVSRVSLNRKL